MKIFSKNQQSCRGMTLVEVLVVAAILGVVIMAVMSLFIPTVKSTAVQTELTDVQSNLRLATNRMTDDLLTAGFLIGTEEPIINQSTTAFTIQTRSVSNSFGIVESTSSPDVILTDTDMIDNFPDGAKIRFINPITAEVIGGTRTVVGVNTGAKTLTLAAAFADIEAEMVIVRVKDDSVNQIQTIRYQLIDSDGDTLNDTLTRTVNADVQQLARGISAVAFDYETTSSGKVNKINISLTGQTQDRGNDILTETKTRSLTTSVTLRNVF